MTLSVDYSSSFNVVYSISHSVAFAAITMTRVRSNETDHHKDKSIAKVTIGTDLRKR